MNDALASLGRMHAAGVTHGDLNHGNVGLVDGKAQLIDFGQSTIVGRDPASLARIYEDITSMKDLFEEVDQPPVNRAARFDRRLLIPSPPRRAPVDYPTRRP